MSPFMRGILDQRPARSAAGRRRLGQPARRGLRQVAGDGAGVEGGVEADGWLDLTPDPEVPRGLHIGDGLTRRAGRALDTRAQRDEFLIGDHGDGALGEVTVTRGAYLQGVDPADFEATYGVTGFDLTGHDEATVEVNALFTAQGSIRSSTPTSRPSAPPARRC